MEKLKTRLKDEAAKTSVGIAKNPVSCYGLVIMLTKVKKQKIIKDAAVHEKDTGSPEVQISILSKRIEELAGHLKKHQKDIHSRRGLLQMVADRQSQMRYLEKKSPKRYGAILKKLELKKK